METQLNDKIYPVEVSASGKNAYYVEGCTVVGHRPPYAACLKKIADRKNGRLETQFSECSAAISKKECPAQRLRKEELEKGEAIYFVSREEWRDRIVAIEQTGGTIDFSHVRPKGAPLKKTPAVEPPKPKHFLDIQIGGFADALNASLTAAPVAEAKPAQPAPPEEQKSAPAVAAKPGMSLIELARLRIAAKAL